MTTSLSGASDLTPEDAGSLWRLPAMRCLAVLTVLGFSSFFLTLAALPASAVRNGTSPASAGLVTAVMLGCTIAVQTVVPMLERRLGTSRLLAVGLVALGAPAPFYLLTHDLGWLLAASAVRGAGFGVLTVLGALISTSVAPRGRRGEAIGIYGLGIAVPNLAAVPAGAALTSAGHFDVVAVLAACPLLAIPLTRRLTSTAPIAVIPAPETSTGRGDIASAIRASGLPSFVLLLVTLAGGGLLTFLPIARPHGALAALALLAMGVSGSVSRWRAGSLHDRSGSRALMPGLLVVAAAGMVLVSLALLDSGDGDGDPLRVAALLVGATVFGIGYGAMQNISQVVAFERAGPRQAPTASAVWNVAFDAGTGIGAYGVGLLAATPLELPGTYLACAVVLLLAVPAAVASTTSRRAAGAD